MKLGKIRHMGFSEFRERDWQNVLTCHQDQASPYMWSYANHTISKVAVASPEHLTNVKVTSVAVSQCGNFGVLGFANGSLTKFNLQSGKDRGVFKASHSNEITGLGMDALNHFLVSCSLDKTIKLWDFYAMKLLSSFTVESPVDNLVYNQKNDLIAISCTDLSLTLLTIKGGLKKVRSFAQVADNKVTDICFSKPDSKWICVSSLDKSLKIFDILTGSLIDWVKFRDAAVSIDFSPSGEFLATSHVGSKAVFLWSNKSYFQNIVIQRVPSAPVFIDLPMLSSSS